MSNQHDSLLDTLPAAWNFDRLKDLVTLRNDKTDVPSVDEDYLELEDVESGTGQILGRRNTLEVESAVTLFKRGDVLFGKLRPYLEKYYQAEFDGKCTGEILAFKPERIAGRFLFYCLGSHWFIERCNALAYGAKMPRVSWQTQMSHLNVPVPPLWEQERIAAYLDATCAAIDAAVAAKRRQLEILDSLRKSTIQTAVTNGLVEGVTLKHVDNEGIRKIPVHWQADRMKDVVALRRKKTDVISEQMDYLELEDLESGTGRIISRGDTLEVETAVTIFNRGDVLFGKLRPYLEKYYHAEFDGKCTGEILVFKPERIIGRFLFYCVASPWFIDRCNVLAYGAKMPRVNWPTQLAKFNLPIPPAREQEAICRLLDGKLGQITRLVGAINAQIGALIAYRKSLIHECVTGRRRISEADVAAARDQAKVPVACGGGTKANG
ncbi:MAG: restriction endonuclease subunit S [Chloroflexi bacterium]|nr:restriction endonuclease subunit S [Chloroflexota bacterium]